MTGTQRADIVRLLDRGEPDWWISQQTGVPADMIEQMRTGAAEYKPGDVHILDEPPTKRRRTDGTPGDTEQTQTGDGGTTQQTQTGTGGTAQQTQTGTGGTTQQTETGTGGATQQTQTGTGGTAQQTQPGTGGTSQQGPATPPQPEPSWGSKQLTQFADDPTKLSKAESDSIDTWLNGKGPAPQSLQAELTARGYSDITPEMIRIFLTQRNPKLTALQIDRIIQFLCI